MSALATPLQTGMAWALLAASVRASLRPGGVFTLHDDEAVARVLGCSLQVWADNRAGVWPEINRLLSRPGTMKAASSQRLDDADRLAVWIRDEGVCAYCGDQTTIDDFQADHVVPKAQGGSDDPENLACACEPCNRSKGARTPEQWRGETLP